MFSKKTLSIIISLLFARYGLALPLEQNKQYPFFETLYKTLYAESKNSSIHASRINYILEGISDKKNPERLSTFLQAIHTYQAQTSPKTALDEKLYEQTELLVLALIAIHQAESLCMDLLMVLNNLLMYQQYWEKINIKPIRKITAQGPLGWTKKEESQNNEQLRKTLEQEIETATHYLGALYYHLQQFSYVQTDQDVDQNIQKTAIIISDCLKHSTINQDSSTELISHKQLHIMFLTNWSRIATYKKDRLVALAEVKKPSHLQHYWLDYTLGALAIGAAGLYWYHHQEECNKLQETVQAAIPNFYRNYLFGPFKRIYNLIFSNNNALSKEDLDHERAVNEAIIAHDQEGFAAIYKDLLRKGQPNLSEEEIEQKSQKAASEGNYSLFEPSYAKQANNAASNILSPSWYSKLVGQEGTLLSILFLKVQRAFILSNKTNMKLNNIFHRVDNLELTLQLFAIIPAALCINALYKIGQTMYNKPSKDMYKTIHAILLKMERILNKHNTTDQCMNFQAQGLLLYWVYALQKYHTSIPATYADDFQADIIELSSSHYEIHQKLGTIQRMYRAYPFLAAQIMC